MVGSLFGSGLGALHQSERSTADLFTTGHHVSMCVAGIGTFFDQPLTSRVCDQQGRLPFLSQAWAETGRAAQGRGCIRPSLRSRDMWLVEKKGCPRVILCSPTHAQYSMRRGGKRNDDKMQEERVGFVGVQVRLKYSGSEESGSRCEGPTGLGSSGRGGC